MATKIECDRCGRHANKGQFSHTPPKITLNRGSNKIWGGIGSTNFVEYDLCDTCYEILIKSIKQVMELEETDETTHTPAS